MARRDERLVARVLHRTPLLYTDGADPALDRPAHVRAASGLAWLEGRLAIVQDDASFVAIWDPRSGRVDAVALPPRPGGARQFDAERGNKYDKLDLEAAFVAPIEGRETLVAIGSGALAARRRMLRMTGDGRVEVIDAAELYLAIEAVVELRGSELNLEGAALMPALGDRPARVRLLQRGNGAVRGDRAPVDASWDVELAALVAYLDGRGPAPRPDPSDVTQFELGALGGVRLTFTDASCSADGRFHYLATAERSPDVIADGEVIGSAVGVEGDDGALWWAPLVDRDGGVLPVKAEGLAFDPGDRRRLLVALDPDQPERASELCQVVLDGPWPGTDPGSVP